MFLFNIYLCSTMAGIQTTSQKRTVVVVGKTGAGKSTVANQFSKSEIGKFKVLLGYGSETEHINFKEVEVEVNDPNQEKRRFTFRIIDTPGVFGTNQEHTSPEAMDQLKQFFQVKVPEGVNLVLFVLKGGIRFTQEERDALDFLTKHFENEISGASALVLTNCESFDDKTRNNLIEEFKTTELTKSYAKFMGKGIHTVGFPDREKMLPELRQMYTETMKKDQEKLINLVISSEKMYLGEDMFKPSFWEKLTKCTIL